MNIPSHLSEKFEKLYLLLTQWNEKFNLTAITDRDGVYEKHFEDSLAGAELIRGGAKVCDVGCGAGFPLLPLALALPSCTFTGVDSLNKRVTYLNEAISVLELENCLAVHSRAEDWCKNHRGEYDVVTARALAPLNILAEYCLPLVKEGGIAVAYKGGDPDEELSAADKAITLMGGKVEKIKKFALSGGDRRTLIVIRKIKPTPSAYPRGGNKPRLHPIS